MKKNKKGMSVWIWILIILILIVVGIILYSVFSGGGSSSILNGLGNSVPSPPPLPN
jgi:flagellar basal body-associated protein FliL